MASAIQFYLRQTGERQSATDRQRTMSSFEEKIRHSIATGKAGLLPWIDAQSGESLEMRRAYRGFLRHPVVKAALLKKVYSVSALDLAINPASDEVRDQEAAEFCLHAYTREIEGGFPKLCETVLLHGLIDGTGVSEPVWSDGLCSRGRWQGKRFYRDLKAKDDVEIEVDAYRNITAVKSMRSSAKWDPAEFVIWRNMPLFEGPGLSDFRAVYAEVWMLDTCKKLRMIHLEKFTSPYFQGEYTDKADKANLEEELAKATSRSWVVVPTGTKIQAMQIASRGESEFQQAIDDMEKKIAVAIAGAFLDMLAASTTGGEMRGSASVARGTTELFIWRLASVMQTVIDRQLTPRLIDHNFIDVGYPISSLGGINYGELLQSIQLEEIAQRMGFKPSRKAFSKKYALQEAADESDALTPTPPASPFGGGGLGGFQFSDRQPCGCAANDSGHSFCRQGVNAGKPGPCPTGVADRPKAGQVQEAAKALYERAGVNPMAVSGDEIRKSIASLAGLPKAQLLTVASEVGAASSATQSKGAILANIERGIWGRIENKVRVADPETKAAWAAQAAKLPKIAIPEPGAKPATAQATKPAPASKATAKPAAKPKAAPKPADVKIKAAADKVAKINVKVTAAKAKLDTLKGELKAAKADLAAVKASVPKQVSARTKANKEAAASIAKELDDYAAAQVKVIAKDRRKAPTTEQIDAFLTSKLGKASPIEVYKASGFGRPKNRAAALAFLRKEMVDRIGTAQRVQI